MAGILNDDFEVKHRVHFQHALPNDQGNVVAVLRTPLAADTAPDVELTDDNSVSCHVHLYGATVTSFKEKSVEHLYLSPKAALDGSAPIRGGIPICWPQFNDMGPNLKHGFARRNAWRVSSARASKLADGDDATKLTLSLDTSALPADALGGWAHAAELTYVVVLSARPAQLSVSLNVTNVGQQAFSFTTALHSYFLVEDCSRILIPHLAGLHYLDNVDERKDKVEQEPIVCIEEEVDRVYLGPLAGKSSSMLLRDPARRRELTLTATGLPDAVVWNPWIEKAKSLPDFPDEDYRTMVCIEAASIGDAPRLAPQQSWTGSLTIKGQHKR